MIPALNNNLKFFLLQPSVVQRSIKKSFCTAQNQIDDKMNNFLELNKINYTNLKESLINNKKDFVYPVVAFLDENILTVHSLKVINGIVLFMLRIYQNLQFQTFQCYISSLSKNHINRVNTWSTLKEIT